MKKNLLTTGFFLVFFLFTSCNKKNDLQTPSQIDLTDNLSFKNYVARNMMEKLKVFEYNTRMLNSNNQSSFRTDLMSASSFVEVENIYAKYSLSTLVLQRYVLLQAAEQAKLIVDIPQLRSLNEEQINEVFSRNYLQISNTYFEHAKAYTEEKIRSGEIRFEKKGVEMNTGKRTAMNALKLQFVNPDYGSEGLDFESLYYSIPTNMSEGEIQAVVDEGLANFAIQYISTRITSDELFSCAKEAFLSLVGSVTGLTGLGKLIATEGISAAIQGISKFILRNSGWVTAAILAADFGMCIYSAAQD